MRTLYGYGKTILMEMVILYQLFHWKDSMIGCLIRMNQNHVKKVYIKY